MNCIYVTTIRNKQMLFAFHEHSTLVFIAFLIQQFFPLALKRSINMPKKNGIKTNKTPQTNASTSSALPEKDSITVDSTLTSSSNKTPTKCYHYGNLASPVKSSVSPHVGEINAKSSISFLNYPVSFP